MNKIYPKSIDFSEIKESETAFLRNLKKVKFNEIYNAEPEVLEIGEVKLIKIRNSKLENFAKADISKEDVNLSHINDMLCKPKSIKEILANEISTPIGELLNIDISSQIQNTFENIVSMVSIKSLFTFATVSTSTMLRSFSFAVSIVVCFKYSSAFLTS